MRSCFLIPAYEPNQQLLLILQELLDKTDAPIFVVDDGSTDASIFQDPLFSNSRLHLLKHASNLGKGAALKTAFNAILVRYPHLE
jgi:glycosyltransferase involved in cell wall biosynthesis